MWHILPHERCVTSAGKKWCSPVGGFFLLSGESCCSPLFIFPFDSFIVTIEWESMMGVFSLLLWLSCTLPIQSFGSVIFNQSQKLVMALKPDSLSGHDHVLSSDFTKCDNTYWYEIMDKQCWPWAERAAPGCKQSKRFQLVGDNVTRTVAEND